MHEPLNYDATIIVPTTLSPSPVAEATERQEVDDHEAPTDAGYNDTDLGPGQLRDLEQEQAELIRRQKQATKERKEGSRKIRDAR